MGSPFRVHEKYDIGRRVEITSVGEHIQERLRQPDPTLGWKGDPFLVATFNHQTQMFEIWDTKPNATGRPNRVCRCDVSGGRRPNVTELIRGLAERNIEHLSAKQYADALDAADEKREKEEAAVQLEKAEELGDHARWALKKDLGHLY